MRDFFSRFIGAILVIVAFSGFAFALIALISLWTYQTTLTKNIIADLNTFEDALSAASQGLSVAEQSLLTSIDSLSALELTIDATGDTLEDTTPLLNTLSIMASEDLPAAITSAQTSLVSAQESAQIIDRVLTTLSNIPFVPKNLYNPPVPLHEALKQVHDSMNPLPNSLNQVETSLNTANDNLEVIETDMDQMVTSMSQIKLGLKDGLNVIDEYQLLTASVQGRLVQIEDRLPGQIQMLVWILTFILVWVGFSQLGLLLQGIALIRTNEPLER